MNAASPSTHKKVLVRYGAATGHREQILGYLDPAQLSAGPTLPLLTTAGQMQELSLDAVQAVYFLSDFGAAAAITAGIAGARQRQSARLPGLRVRVRTRDRFNLEGILASPLLDLESGVSLTPLHAQSPWQRVYLPRTAVADLVPLEMVRPRRPRRAPPEQFDLFGAAPAETNPSKESEDEA